MARETKEEKLARQAKDLSSQKAEFLKNWSRRLMRVLASVRQFDCVIYVDNMDEMFTVVSGDYMSDDFWRNEYKFPYLPDGDDWFEFDSHLAELESWVEIQIEKRRQEAEKVEKLQVALSKLDKEEIALLAEHYGAS